VPDLVLVLVDADQQPELVERLLDRTAGLEPVEPGEPLPHHVGDDRVVGHDVDDSRSWRRPIS
jgi:hypothetical protein